MHEAPFSQNWGDGSNGFYFLGHAHIVSLVLVQTSACFCCHFITVCLWPLFALFGAGCIWVITAGEGQCAPAPSVCLVLVSERTQCLAGPGDAVT